MNNIIRKTNNSIFSIAKTLVKMESKGYFPTEYNLPYITFSKEGELAELSPALQVLVEEKMNKIIENRVITIHTNLNGLLKLLNNPDSSLSKNDFPKSDDITIYFDFNNKLDFATLNKTLDSSNLSILDLNKFVSFLKRKNITHNSFYKETALRAIHRLNKLKRGL